MRGAFLAGALALLTAASAAGAPPSGPDVARLLAERPPATLSATRLFRDTGAREPNAGVIPYDLATPLFTDYALKFRYAFTPRGAKAVAGEDGLLQFPVGAVLVKTFAYPADLRAPERDVRFLETRLLVRKRDGWDALTYVWDADGREARLRIVGGEIPVDVTGADGAPLHITYEVPNKNQCKGCHALGDAVTPIGPRLRNIDVPAWTAAGLIEAPANPPARIPTFDAPAAASLDARARAYLDVNCAHCHNPRGPASTSGLDLRFAQTDPLQWGVRKRPVAAGRAAGDMLFAIDPGNPDRSILLYRMESADPGVMMPELGRTLVHREGVDLVRRWIAAMDSSGRVAETAPRGADR